MAPTIYAYDLFCLGNPQETMRKTLTSLYGGLLFLFRGDAHLVGCQDQHMP